MRTTKAGQLFSIGFIAHAHRRSLQGYIDGGLRPKVRKTPLFEPFIYENEHFTKTGSGQTEGKLKKEVRFSQEGHDEAEGGGADNSLSLPFPQSTCICVCPEPVLANRWFSEET
jgi:hypothetical protein